MAKSCWGPCSCWRYWRPILNLGLPPELPCIFPPIPDPLGQVPDLRPAGGGGGSGLGLLRHPVPGHGAFFALGGYAMGMYLMRQIGDRGVYGNPDIARLHGVSQLGGVALVLVGLRPLRLCPADGGVGPGPLAFVFGWFAFRSRVTGVYLSIITQALTYALMLAFFRNEMGFGGNNGLTDFKDLLGFDLQADSTRVGLFLASALALALGYLSCRAVVLSKLGRVAMAIRDAEERTAFHRLSGGVCDALDLHLLRRAGGDRRGPLCPPGRHHQPRRVFAPLLHRDRHLGGGGRARHPLWGGGRRLAGELLQDLVHRRPARGLALCPGRHLRGGDALPAQRARGPGAPLERLEEVRP